MSLPKQLIILFLGFFAVLGAWMPKANVFSVAPVMAHQENKYFHVKHDVKGNNVLIECIAPSFPFQNGTDGGHVNVYVNGQKVNEVYTAAFMLRGLPAGKHVVRIELVYNDGKITGLSHEFTVTIP
ncbi:MULTISPECIES: hypothetical protein [Parageobacillus]|jgi:hypothetical protein|uniref:Uncharacterized protein n=1 Tax=Parageobacillus thermoglucosidasius TaxID=1426 RepID=A0A1B7KTS8_PARTM|nr:MULTISPECIES: hypothetical protein [Parageobacillus]OAT73479.1 hypothetical protein A7K69_05725 [Parageobacillus thermoglucosidasius]